MYSPEQNSERFSNGPPGNTRLLLSHVVSAGEGITKRGVIGNPQQYQCSTHPFFSWEAGPPQTVRLNTFYIIKVHVHILISNVYLCFLLSSKKSVPRKKKYTNIWQVYRELWKLCPWLCFIGVERSRISWKEFNLINSHRSFGKNSSPHIRTGQQDIVTQRRHDLLQVWNINHWEWSCPWCSSHTISCIRNYSLQK